MAARVIPVDDTGWFAATLRALVSLGVVASAMIGGIALAMLLTAPILDQLSCRVEQVLTGKHQSHAAKVRAFLIAFASEIVRSQTPAPKPA